MMRVAFVHPDLGIGGAERLVVDAAVGLQQRGHSVDVFTAHRDVSHCFAPTADGTLRVHVRGDWLPRTVLGRLHAVCAALRCVWVALCIALFWRGRFDVVFADQVSVVVPVLRALAGTRVLFYCHYPDQLLAGDRSTWLKRAYRKPLDWLEERTTGAADAVLVNSRFTASVFDTQFPSIAPRVRPRVLYPAIDFAAYDRPASTDALRSIPGCDVLLLSINRFERKKNLALAVETLAALREHPAAANMDVRLALAGGYDPRVPENAAVLDELRALAAALGVAEHVAYYTSFSDDTRAALLERARCVLYTPENEHFGIVPVEAMYARVPVIACNSGGPRESIVHGRTGFLCQPTAAAFAAAAAALAAPVAVAVAVPPPRPVAGEGPPEPWDGGDDDHHHEEQDEDEDESGGLALARRMGRAGRRRAVALFSLRAFSARLEQHLAALCHEDEKEDHSD